MDDLTRTRMWIDTVPPLDPDTREVILDLIEHAGGPVHPAELVRLFEDGEAGIAVVNAVPAVPAPGAQLSDKACTP
ncbi:hypothetical protein [Streptomyces microflavus]|uniref:hypothetical protein n=1 Tax=Streptomyces microflavus TaxID=1919 RepID=UPI0033E78821